MATEVHPPSSPTSSKKGGMGFLKRHLGHHRRRSSSVTFPNSQPHINNVQGTPQPAKAEAPELLEPPRSAMRKASIGSDNELIKVTSNGTERSNVTFESTVSDDQSQPPRHGSKTGGVRWAANFDAEKPQAPRPRRTSSAGAARRSSIFLRIDGGFAEGVDAGVGSKARRLSLAIPEELQVDECPLGDHFSMFSRAGKKDIGEGGAAVVRLMQSKTAGTGKDKLFAVKEFREWEPYDEQEWEYVRKIKSEYAIAKACQHPNIVETFRLCHSDKKWFHVMEYCDLGDLNDIINKAFFSREDRDCMFKQLLRGVEYLHSRGLAHRDIKSENLLLTKDGCLKIADFGTAEVFSGTHPGLKGCRRQSVINADAEIRKCKPGMVGSKPYMAPEIVSHKEDYDPRGVDVWSCAIVYLTLCIGGTPWECASTDIKNYNIYCQTWDDWLDKNPDGKITQGKGLPAFAGTKQFQCLGDMETKRLVLGMLHPDPSKRWSARDALDSKTVTDYPCCQQAGYSDDIKTRQRKALHNHVPPKSAKSAKSSKGAKFLKPK